MSSSLPPASETGPDNAAVPPASLVKYRTVWISDLHLGARGSSAVEVLEFLKTFECEKLYIDGDFVDLWQLRKSKFWPQEHNDVIHQVLRIARRGTPIIYIPGNHDDFSVNFVGTYGNIEVVLNSIHVTADGRRLLVLHGHEFDNVTQNAKWLAVLGDVGYNMLMKVNTLLNFFRRIFGFGYWSLSAYVKRKVKNAVSVVSDFEQMVAKYAEMHKTTGIVCGHIHTPSIREIRGVQYYNCGDWVESCTALVEHFDGRMELIYWKQRPQPLTPQSEPAQPAPAGGGVVPPVAQGRGLGTTGNQV